MNCGGRYQWPNDLHSAAWQSLELFRSLRSRYMDCPREVGQIIRHARTYPEVRADFAKLDRFRQPGARV